VVDALFWTFAAAGVISAYLVFRVDSMVRAAFWLLGSFLAVGAILILLEARFLGLVLLLMMAGEMSIMAVFMVMFMMNPAGLNPMTMVHQHRTAVIAGVVAFAGLAAAGVFTEFPDARAPQERTTTAALGEELLGNSMLVFETAGFTLLATMVGTIAIATRRGRYGDAEEGSVPPGAERDDAPRQTAGTDEHAGHGA